MTPATALPDSNHDPGDSQATRRTRRLARTIAAVAVAAFVIPVALAGYGYVNKWRPSSDLARCATNLNTLNSVVFQRYSREHRGAYPPLSSSPGVLMFQPGSIPADVDIGTLSLTCPTIRSARGEDGRPGESGGRPRFDDQSYFYLGYAVLDDDDIDAFARGYRERIAAGGDFLDDLVVDDGTGRTRTLYRLSGDVKEIWRATGDPNAVSPYEGRESGEQAPGIVTADIPVLIERDRGHVRADSDGRPRGAMVLFLYRGAQFVERGTWPMTEKTQRILAELAESKGRS